MSSTLLFSSNTLAGNIGKPGDGTITGRAGRRAPGDDGELEVGVPQQMLDPLPLHPLDDVVDAVPQAPLEPALQAAAPRAMAGRSR